MFGFVSRKDHDNEITFHLNRYDAQALRHEELVERFRAAVKEKDTAHTRLARIAALETPNAAHGLKKACKIARGEL